MIRSMMTSPLASLVILVLGAQFFQIYITLALAAASYSEFDIGIVHAASYAGLLLSALYSEKLIHRIGHIRAFTTFSGIITATILIQAFHINLCLWIIARFCSGLALAALYVTIESWLLAESTLLDRGKRLALYMITLYFSQAMSSQLLHLVDPNSLQPYLLAALMCALASIPVSLTYKVTPILPQRVPLNIREIFDLSPYGFFGCLTSGLILSALYSFMPNYASEYHLSVPWIMTTLICGGFILQWPLGKLSDLFNRQKVLVLLSLACVLPAGFLIVLPNSMITYLLVFLTGGLSFALYPISISLTCDRIENKCIVQATGVLLFAYGLGSVLGPLLVAGAIDYMNSNRILFAFIASVVATYGLLGVYQWLRTPLEMPSEIDAVDCVPLPRQSPLANQLDPRQEVDTAGMCSMPMAANEEPLAEITNINSPEPEENER